MHEAHATTATVPMAPDFNTSRRGQRPASEAGWRLVDVVAGAGMVTKTAKGVIGDGPPSGFGAAGAFRTAIRGLRAAFGEYCASAFGGDHGRGPAA